MTVSKELPRGLRVNNPLNIDKSARNKWQGKITPSADRRFEQFETMVYGLRAGCVLIINHYDRKKANSIRKLIHVWAPPKENQTDVYAETVAKWAGIDPDETVNFHKYEVLKPVVTAMVRFEQGMQPLTDAQIDRGLAMAGVTPSKPGKVRNMGGPTTTALGTGGSGMVEILTNAQSAISPLQDYLEIAKYLSLGLIVIGLGWTIYSNWDSIRRLQR